MRRILFLWTIGMAGCLGATGCKHRSGMCAPPACSASAPAPAATAAPTAIPSAPQTSSPPANQGYAIDSNESVNPAPNALPPMPPSLPPVKFDGPATPEAAPPSLPGVPLSHLRRQPAPEPEVIVISGRPKAAPTQPVVAQPPLTQPSVTTTTRIEEPIAPAPSTVPPINISTDKPGIAASWTVAEPVQTLTGEVQQFRRTWRLRYAPIDSDDAHGGSVALAGEGLERLQDGQRVRVTGVLRAASDRSSPATFRLLSLDILAP